MDLRLVEIFCSVYDLQSFSKAAVALGLSQPTVSGHIKALESRLDCRLFDRLGRDIEPTPSGQLLYEYGHRIVSLKGAAAEALERFLGRVEGRLTLGASTSPGNHWLPLRVAGFHKRNPAVRVRMIIGDSSSIVASLLAGEVEAGFVGVRIADRALVYEPFAEDRLILVGPPDVPWLRAGEPLSVDELRRLPLLMREPGSGTRAATEDHLVRNGYSLDDLDVAAELGSTVAITEAIIGRFGVAFVPSRAVRRDIDAGRLRAIELAGLPPILRRLFSVIDRRRSPSPLREAFLSDLSEGR